MALLSQRLEAPIDVLGKALDEHEGSDLLRGRGGVLLLVEQFLQLLQRAVAMRRNGIGSRLDGCKERESSCRRSNSCNR